MAGAGGGMIDQGYCMFLCYSLSTIVMLSASVILAGDNSVGECGCCKFHTIIRREVILSKPTIALTRTGYNAIYNPCKFLTPEQIISHN